MFSRLLFVLGPLVVNLVNGLMPILPLIVDAIGQVINAVLPLVSTLISGLLPILPSLVDLFLQVVNAIVPIASAIISNALLPVLLDPHRSVPANRDLAVGPIIVALVDGLARCYRSSLNCSARWWQHSDRSSVRSSPAYCPYSHRSRTCSSDSCKPSPLILRFAPRRS